MSKVKIFRALVVDLTLDEYILNVVLFRRERSNLSLSELWHDLIALMKSNLGYIAHYCKLNYFQCCNINVCLFLANIYTKINSRHFWDCTLSSFFCIFSVFLNILIWQVIQVVTLIEENTVKWLTQLVPCQHVLHRCLTYHRIATSVECFVWWRKATAPKMC